MDERLTILIYHVRDTADEIASFIANADIARLQGDLMFQRALVMSLLIIGELVSRIQDRHSDFAASRPDLPWDQVRGLRNRIAHG